MPDQNQGFLGTSFPTPTDPQFFLGQTGLSSLIPQAFNANSMSAMFSPQGMNYTPLPAMQTNPFLKDFLQESQDATKTKRMQAPNGFQQMDPNQQGAY